MVSRSISGMADKKITMANYGDYELFGQRIQTNKLIASLKAGNDSECIIYAKGTFAAKEQLRLRDLIGTDKRLRQMAQELAFEHAVPVQRYSWQKIDKSCFPNLFVSAKATGKTYAHLLYVVSKCLAATPISEVEEALNSESSCHVTSEHYLNSEDLVSNPKYIIICSSQDKVESIYRIIDHMKGKAYGTNIPNAKRQFLTPVARTVKLDHDDGKLAQRCIESDILIGNPQVLTRCLKQNLFAVAKCKKIFFDDLDVALQVHNNNIRELIKTYLLHTQNGVTADDGKTCQIHMFASKWTDLVKQFLSSVFPQRTVLFSSIVEAAIYANVRFEVEGYEEPRRKIDVLTNLLKQLEVGCSKTKSKIAVVCKSDEEADKVSCKLSERGFKAKLIRMEVDDTNGELIPVTSNEKQFANSLLFVISDNALEFEVEFSPRKRPLNDIMHLVHASMPDNMSIFDQRFRLLYKNIQDAKSGMTSTQILDTKADFKLAKQMYDIASRSPVTMKSTKYLLRSLTANQPNQICWRWAVTGLCRFDKLARNDRFGSYCPDRHGIQWISDKDKDNSDARDLWPGSGMVKLSITHIISPTEFYFIFEACKTIEDGKWVNYKTSGTEYMKTVQKDLNLLRNIETRSVPLNHIKKGFVYGVYFPQELRVDRVLILDEPKHEESCTRVNEVLEYSKQISIFKIDHGVCLDVYVKNLIELPEALAKIPGQCHRGFHLGYKPPDNEPNWLYKSKKKFYDVLCDSNQVQEITSWIRMKHEGCFWFEGTLVSRKLSNIDSNELWTVDPFEELRSLGLAEISSTEPPILPISTRSETICRWNHAKMVGLCQQAFLRRDVAYQEVFLLTIDSKLNITLRPSAYNGQLINLERQLVSQYLDGKLSEQKYVVPGVICIAKLPSDPSFPSELSLNRSKILSVHDSFDLEIEEPSSGDQVKVLIECLDHGDTSLVPKSALFEASPNHLSVLPFQAIKCEFANLNNHLSSDKDCPSKFNQIINKIYDVTREEDNAMLELKCKLDVDGKVFLYVPNPDKTRYTPLCMRLQNELQVELHDKPDTICQEVLEVTQPTFSKSDMQSGLVFVAMMEILQDIVKETLFRAKQSE